MSKVHLPAWPADKPLETLQTILARVNRQLESYNFGHDGDAASSFQELATTNLTQLDQFAIGNSKHLITVSLQTYRVTSLIRDMGGLIETEHLPYPRRTHVATRVLLAAAQMVDSALLMHMRATPWYVNSTLILLRTSIELAVKSGFIARGTGSEATRWEEGPLLPTEDERRAAQFSAAKCCRELAPFISTQQPAADSPVDVYTWLCQYTHLDDKVLNNPPSHEDAYAVMAYIAWMCAAISEIILGVPGVAKWPEVWPVKLPWRSEGAS